MEPPCGWFVSRIAGQERRPVANVRRSHLSFASGIRTALLTIVLVAANGAAKAQCPPSFNWSGFYPSAALDRVAQRTVPGLRSNFEQVLLPHLTESERGKLGRVTLDLGQREYAGHPLNFYATRDRRVVMPLSSVKLVSDLMLALAWRNRNRLPENKVFDYAAMLAFRGPSPDGVAATPLATLGVPTDADSTPAVDALFQKMFGTAIVYIMSHEVGHLLHDHRGGVDAARSRAQEAEADAFAVDVMARMGAAPIGVSFYFMIASAFECPTNSTHPLSGERVMRVASAITDKTALFVRGKPNPPRERQQIEDIAADLRKVAPLLDDPDVRQATRQIGMSAKVSDFTSATASNQRRQAVSRQAFDGSYVGQWTDAKGTSLDVRMTLRREGQAVRGTYEFGMGAAELEGLIDGEQLNYAWKWGREYFGRGVLRNDGDRLEGTWGYTQRTEGGGRITLTAR